VDAMSGCKMWSGQPTPLMRLGSFAFQCKNLVDAPNDLLRAAADYCQSRVANFARQKNNHRNRSSVKFYSMWLGHIRRALGEVAS